MQLKWRWALLVASLLILAALNIDLSNAQSGGERYFSETGHSVGREFLKHFESASDPIKIYGYPITEAFIAPESSPVAGLRVQYFQKARFELHPGNSNEQKVVISPLGEYIYAIDQPASQLRLPANHPACRFFSETEHQVCYGFLTFFDTNGGIEQFGYPITDILITNDRIVQYFQRARFEWNDHLPKGQKVTLANLGQIYFQLYEDQSYRQPLDNILYTILDLQVRAFVQQAVMPSNGQQTVFVTIQDQNLRPVPNVQVTFTVKLSSGDHFNRVMPLTNERGVTSTTLTLNNQPLGITEILVVANFNHLEKRTRTSYRVWY